MDKTCVPMKYNISPTSKSTTWPCSERLPIKLVSLSFFHSSCPSLVCAGDLYSLMSKLLGQSKDLVHIHKYNPSKMQRVQPELVAQIHSLIQKKNLGSPSAKLAFQTGKDPVLVRDRVHKFHQLEATAKPSRSNVLSEGQGGSRMPYYCCHRCR